jgi:methanol:N,N-dimethyl-4-nitrosoaniline oxidoreductase
LFFKGLRLFLGYNDQKKLGEEDMIDIDMAEFPVLFTNAIPRIIFGWGAHKTVADECKAAKISRAMITTTGLRGTGIIDEIKSILNYNGISSVIFDKVTSNPKDYQIMQAYQLFKESNCDGLVSIGGGSSHDCAKGVRVVAANGGKDIKNFFANIDPPWMETLKKVNPCTIPQIAVNTTAGTGAEVTSWAAITDVKFRAKGVVGAPNICATAAINDPALIRLQPGKYAAWSGFDAMTHGFEAFVTKVQGPYAYGILLRAIQLVSENVREFAFNRMNGKACENMCAAATMGGIGIGFGNGAGIVHGLGHQLSALTDAHHGLANAVITLAGENYNRPACPEKFAAMVQAMGIDTRKMSTLQAADRWFVEMENLLKDLGITSGNLNKQFGLKKEDFPHIVKVYSNDFTVQGNPRQYNYEETIQLLESLY